MSAAQQAAAECRGMYSAMDPSGNRVLLAEGEYFDRSGVLRSADCLVGRAWPDLLDRRRATETVDVDLSHPMRRATDPHPMANTLQLQAFKASERRFSGESVTDHGALL